MTHKTKFTINQCMLDDRNVLAKEEWAGSFCQIWDSYSGKPVFYPAVLLDKSDKAVASGAVIYESRTAWICGLSVSDVLDETHTEFVTLELLSHLTDFCNFLQQDNILAVVTEKDRALWHLCGYSATAILGKYSQPYVQPDILANPSIRQITPADARRVQAFVTEVINEKRNVIWDAPLSGFVYEEAGSLQGVMLLAGNAPVYAVSQPAARALLGLRLLNGKPITGVPDDNVYAKNLLDEYGCVLQSEMFRVSLGRDNRWKPQAVFCGFADFCA